MCILFMNSDLPTPEKKGKPFDLTPRWEWVEKLPEQIVNALIVAAITFFATLGATAQVQWKPAIIALGMTFFVELRKNLGIK